jgi:transcription initiation factor IIF auxiliary subunit
MPDKFTIQQSEKYDGDDWWNWAVWVEGSDDELNSVKSVEWNLHPTFTDPVRTSIDRQSKFRLDTAGWGTFPIQAVVQLEDGREIKLKHELELHYPDTEQAEEGPTASASS